MLNLVQVGQYTVLVKNAYVSDTCLKSILKNLYFLICSFFFEKQKIKNKKQNIIIFNLACAVGYTGNNCDIKCTFLSYGHDG